MSCSTTSATRSSRRCWPAVLTASAAASSHEVLLVPMISVTLYTLMALSFDDVRAYAPRGTKAVRFGLAIRPGADSDQQARRAPPDLSLALTPGGVQDRCPADPRPRCAAIVTEPATHARFCRRQRVSGQAGSGRRGRDARSHHRRPPSAIGLGYIDRRHHTE